MTSLVVHTKLFLMFQLMLTMVFYPLSLQPCITAQDLSWHQEHFVCSRCNTDLSQGGYTLHNSRDAVCVHVCMCVYVSKPLSLPPPPPPPPPPPLSLSLPFPLSLPISLPLPPSPSLPPSLSLSQVRDSTWRLGSCYVVVAMENHTEPRVEGVDQRLEETSCGWRLWISSGTLTASLAL